MMDWLSSLSDMCCHCVIERHRAEDCVNVREVCVSMEAMISACDVLYERICPNTFRPSGIYFFFI